MSGTGFLADRVPGSKCYQTHIAKSGTAQKVCCSTLMIGRVLAGAFDADTSPFYEHWKHFHPKVNSLRDASGWGVGKKISNIYGNSANALFFFPSAGLLLGYSSGQKSHPLVRLQQLYISMDRIFWNFTVSLFF